MYKLTSKMIKSVVEFGTIGDKDSVFFPRIHQVPEELYDESNAYHQMALDLVYDRSDSINLPMQLRDEYDEVWKDLPNFMDVVSSDPVLTAEHKTVTLALILSQLFAYREPKDPRNAH